MAHANDEERYMVKLAKLEVIPNKLENKSPETLSFISCARARASSLLSFSGSTAFKVKKRRRCSHNNATLENLVIYQVQDAGGCWRGLEKRTTSWGTV